MIVLYISAIILTAINVVIWKEAPDDLKNDLQTYAPVWIPRNVLFECMICTSFWLSVPGALIAVLISGNLYYTTLPFIAACLTFLYFDIEHKLK